MSRRAALLTTAHLYLRLDLQACIARSWTYSAHMKRRYEKDKNAKIISSGLPKKTTVKKSSFSQAVSLYGPFYKMIVFTGSFLYEPLA